MNNIGSNRKSISSKLAGWATPFVLLAVFSIGSGLSSPLPRCFSADLYHARPEASNRSAFGCGAGDDIGCQDRQSACPLAGKKKAAEKSDACRSLLMKLKAQVSAKSATDQDFEHIDGFCTFLSSAPVSDYGVPSSFKDTGYKARSSPIILQKMSFLN